MIRILPVFCFLFFALSSEAQTKLWNGKGDGASWNDALNWMPAGVPAPADDILLDNSAITVSYTVILPGGISSTSINSLTITPSGSENIILKLPASNTSPTAFTANGFGDAIVLNKGAIFINSSGTDKGTPVSVTGNNFFRINNGGKYVHNTISGHTNLVSRLSTTAGTENGIFEFDVPKASYTISLPERTYGSLVLSSTANAGVVTYSGNGIKPIIINGDFQINEGVTFSIGLAADFIVGGNYRQESHSAFNVQNSNANNIVKLNGNISVQGTITKTGIGLPVIELNGSLHQDISVTGNITNNVSFRMNNAAGATLLAPLTLPYNLDLKNGKIKTDLTNMLTLIENANITGGSSASFIEGPMNKIGDDNNFLFPVGKGSIYAPVRFSAPGMSITDVYQAEYFRSNPQTIYGTNYEPGLIHHISYAEYWQLEKTTGSITIPVSVTLTATEYSFAKDLNSLSIAAYNSSDHQWKSTGVALRSPGASSSPYVTGSLTSVPITRSGIFTLASSVIEAINPLPVHLISFDAVTINDNKIKITWECTADNLNTIKFEMERSVNDHLFAPLKIIQGNSTDRFYTLYDDQMNAGVTRYRLKIIFTDGSSMYSDVVSLHGDMKDWFISIFPNPVFDKAFININSPTRLNLNLVIYDISGKQIRQWNCKIISGNSHIPLQTESMKSGIYFLSVTDEKEKKLVRFIKM